MDPHWPGLPQLPLFRQGQALPRSVLTSLLLLESSAGPVARLGSGPAVPSSTTTTTPTCGSHAEEEALAVPGLWPPPAAAKPHYMHLGFWHSVWIRRQTHQRWISTPHAPCSGVAWRPFLPPCWQLLSERPLADSARRRASLLALGSTSTDCPLGWWCCCLPAGCGSSSFLFLRLRRAAWRARKEAPGLTCSDARPDGETLLTVQRIPDPSPLLLDNAG